MRQMFLALAVAAVGGFALANCGGSQQQQRRHGQGHGGGGPAPADMSIAQDQLPGRRQLRLHLRRRRHATSTPAPRCARRTRSRAAPQQVGRGRHLRPELLHRRRRHDDRQVRHDRSRPGMAGRLLCDPGSTYAQCSDMNYMSTVCCRASISARHLSATSASTERPMARRPACARIRRAPTAWAPRRSCTTQFNACLNDM